MSGTDKNIKIEDTNEGLRIEIPWTRNNFHIILTFATIILWIGIGIYLILDMALSVFEDESISSFITIYFLFMYLLGFFYLVGLLRLILFGKEFIQIDQQTIQIKIRNYFFAKKRTYQLTHCKNLQVGQTYCFNVISTENRYMIFRLSKYGTIQFEYQGKLVSFGIEVNEKQGKMLADIIDQKGLIALLKT